MNKQEVIIALNNGYKVKHRMFSKEEWMKLEGNMIRFEDDCLCSWHEFWVHRNDQVWEEDWSIFNV